MCDNIKMHAEEIVMKRYKCNWKQYSTELKSLGYADCITSSFEGHDLCSVSGRSMLVSPQSLLGICHL